jgi:hypothetical protein
LVHQFVTNTPPEYKMLKIEEMGKGAW